MFIVTPHTPANPASAGSSGRGMVSGGPPRNSVVFCRYRVRGPCDQKSLVASVRPADGHLQFRISFQGLFASTVTSGIPSTKTLRQRILSSPADNCACLIVAGKPAGLAWTAAAVIQFWRAHSVPLPGNPDPAFREMFMSRAITQLMNRIMLGKTAVAVLVMCLVVLLRPFELRRSGRRAGQVCEFVQI